MRRPHDPTGAGGSHPTGQVCSLSGIGRDQHGAALALALFLVLIFSGLCVYALDLTHMEIPRVVKQRDQMQALYVAEAGAERAYAGLRAALTAGAADFDTMLTTNGGYLDLDGNGAAGVVPGTTTPLFETFTIGGTVAGQYRVQVVNNRNGTGATYVNGNPFTVPAATAQTGGSATDDTDKIVHVLSTGQVTAGGVTSVRQIETRMAPTGLSAFTAGCGVSNPGLQISGNPAIAGSQGSVHTNCNATLNGNPTISQNLTSSGTNTITGSSTTVGGQSVAAATAAGDIKNNVPVIPIPPIVLADYRNSSYLRADTVPGNGTGDYILRVETDFSVTIKRITSWDPDPITGTIPTTVPVAIAGPGASLGPWPSGSGGWKFTGGASGTWDYNGNNVPTELENRAFYIERASPAQNVLNGSAKIGGSPPSGGPGTPPWGMTLIADGHIDISGNPNLQTSGHSGNIQLVAGTDIQLGGTVTSTPATGGIIAAREQIQINGNGSFVGLFVAQDAANTDTFVNATQINGNPTITYNGAPPPPSSWNLPLVRTFWRQIQ